MQTPSRTSQPATESALLDLRDYVGVLRRRKQLVALIALIAAGAAIAWTAMQPRVYSATAEVLVRPPILAVGDTTSTRMFVAAGERGIETVMVVSALAGEGKSTTAANLAMTLAQADRNGVLVSPDLPRPRVYEFVGLAGDPGLSEVIEGGRRAWESLRSGRIDNLWVMSSRKGYEGLAAAVAGDTWNAGGEQGPVGARLEPLRRRSAG